MSLGRFRVLFSSRFAVNLLSNQELFHRSTPLANHACLEARRHLFSSENLGLEGYKRQKAGIRDKLGNLEAFTSRMNEYIKASETNTIFTEDLKMMVYLAESDSELETLLKMMRRFHAQNSDMRFSNFIFGPLVMRLLHFLNKPDLAYELFNDKSLEGFFEQMSTFLVLMDLLYENQQYSRVLEIMYIARDKNVAGVKYPMDCTTLALAACYKMNTAESLQQAVALLKDISTEADSAVSTSGVSTRTSIYAAMLALSQKKPEMAFEMLAAVRRLKSTHLQPNVAYFNAKVLVYTRIGRLHEAVQMLKSIVEQDVPDHVKFRGEIFDDILNELEAAVAELRDKVLSHHLQITVKALRDGGHIVSQSFSEYLNHPILRRRRVQDGYKHRFRPPVDTGLQQGQQRRYTRPSLKDEL